MLHAYYFCCCQYDRSTQTAATGGMSEQREPVSVFSQEFSLTNGNGEACSSGSTFEVGSIDHGIALTSGEIWHTLAALNGSPERLQTVHPSTLNSSSAADRQAQHPKRPCSSEGGDRRENTAFLPILEFWCEDNTLSVLPTRGLFASLKRGHWPANLCHSVRLDASAQQASRSPASPPSPCSATNWLV